MISRNIKFLVPKIKVCLSAFSMVTLLCTCSLFAQSNELDSITILNQLSSSNLDSLQLSLNMSRRNGSKFLIGQSLRRIIAVSEEKNDSYVMLSALLQLKDHFNKYPNSKRQSQLLSSLGDFYLKEQLPEKAIKYYNQSASIDQQEYSSETLMQLSDAYLMMNEIDSAIIFRNQILALEENSQNEKEALSLRREIVSILIQHERYDEALVHNLHIKSKMETQNKPALLTIANNNLGYNYNLLKDHKTALEYFQVAEKMNKRNDYIDISELYTNLGIVHGNLGDLADAIDYLSKAEKKINKKNDPKTLANLYHITSTIYYINGDVHNALIYAIKSNDLTNKIGDSKSLKEEYLTTSLIYQDLYEYDKTLEFYQKHLNLRDSVLVEERLEQLEKIQAQNQIDKTEKEIKLLLVNQEVQSLSINQLQLEKEKLSLAGEKLKLESDRKENEFALMLKEQEIKESKFKNQALITQRAQQELALAEQKLINQKADQDLFALKQKEALAQAELKVNQALKQERDKEIALLTKDKELLTKDKELLTNKQKIDELQLEQEANFRNTAYGIGGLLGLMMLMFLGGLLNSRRKNKILGKQKVEIEKQKDLIESNRDLIGKEKEKSDALLLNILPKETAAELKTHGFAKPQHYDQVSVLFTDFSNFTSLSEGLSAEELIQELNKHFLVFDDICQKYNIEKIKTIGDSYMCASGLPQKNKTHAKDIILAAIEMQNFVSENNVNRRKQNLKLWEMRAGIHTGPIIAGVVGSKKFSYDIWGDTVNTASRMESSGEVGQINISASTYNKVKHEFKCTFRGKVTAKHKGELDMYFVEY